MYVIILQLKPLDYMLKSYGEIHSLQFSIITYSEGQNSQQY